jgi:hypothetical protein
LGYLYKKSILKISRGRGIYFISTSKVTSLKNYPWGYIQKKSWGGYVTILSPKNTRANTSKKIILKNRNVVTKVSKNQK